MINFGHIFKNAKKEITSYKLNLVISYNSANETLIL